MPRESVRAEGLKMDNYFITIESHFQERRGDPTILSPRDFSLMEAWHDSGIPLEAVLRGIDVVFDGMARNPDNFRRVNSLSYCTQAVLTQCHKMVNNY